MQLSQMVACAWGVGAVGVPPPKFVDCFVMEEPWLFLSIKFLAWALRSGRFGPGAS